MDKNARAVRRESLPVERLPLKFCGDDQWVITRPFFAGGETRIRNVLDRVSRLSDEEVRFLLGQVRENFAQRHRKIDAVFDEHYAMVARVAGELDGTTEPRRLLIGSYFTMEYAFASAALFNPSIVPHPDQSNIPAGAKRFILSLRATGEGHISSLVFRTGVIGADHSIVFDPPAQFRHHIRMSTDRKYDKPLFSRKLYDLAIDKQSVDIVMNELDDSFTFVELEHAIAKVHQENPEMLWLEETADGMHWLARENYQLRLSEDAEISEIVIFPQSDNESMGIEDLRMVPFVDDDGSVTYYGTYTAYNGYGVLPQLIETTDFHLIRIHTMNGACVQNKGMALFPRRIDGHYCMCSRIDGENLYIMFSDIVEFWESAELLQAPKHPWEFMQIGNCGSPLETSEGWLLLTHGVGPMRQYCIGAMLLDRNDPLKVIGHLDEPLLMPTGEEREGYVPNVVYSCGAMLHNESLFVPYAMSDTATGFAVVPLNALLDRLLG